MDSELGGVPFAVYMESQMFKFFQRFEESELEMHLMFQWPRYKQLREPVLRNFLYSPDPKPDADLDVRPLEKPKLNYRKVLHK